MGRDDASRRIGADTYHAGWKKLRKLRANKNDYRNFQFDVLMANPPFAGDIKQTDMLSPYELAHKVNKDGVTGKLETAVGRDLLFIERNLDFLKPGGRMAVVLPQGRFNNAATSACASSSPNAAASSPSSACTQHLQAPHRHEDQRPLRAEVERRPEQPGRSVQKMDDYNIFFATQR